MGKSTNDLVLDAPLDVIATATRMIACSAEPTNFTEAVATLALADVALLPADFTKSNGDVSGRKTTVSAKPGALIDLSGTANHVALVDVANTRLLYVTTCSPQPLTANGVNTLNFPAWDIEFADPV